MLTLEIEWLGGVARLARGPAEPAPDWPPQPDRVFSALVASWGARGERDDERAALVWLEACPPPALEATPLSPTEEASAFPRTTVTSFVPPNDDRATLTKGRLRILPDQRSRQPRQFPAVRLPDHGPHLMLHWSAVPDADALACLQALAADTSYVGHSSSLVRCRFRTDGEEGRALLPFPIERAPYEGRLAELEALYRQHEAGDERARPRSVPVVGLARSTEAPAPPRSVFSQRWSVLAHAGGDRPDLRGAAVLGRKLRDALMSAMPDPVPDWVSGHTADGKPLDAPHLAIVPLADVGHRHAEGRLMGLAIVPPRHVVEHWDDATPEVWAERRRFEGAVDALSRAGTISLRLGAWGVWALRPTSDTDVKALHPARYCRPARRFSSFTPIALDRHPKGGAVRQASETVAAIVEACRRIGLPEPVEVETHKHAAITGAPSAWPPGGTRVPAGWARPGHLAHRRMTHATLRFGEEIEGPVLLGAGRFFGLGLCLPMGGAR